MSEVAELVDGIAVRAAAAAAAEGASVAAAPGNGLCDSAVATSDGFPESRNTGTFASIGPETRGSHPREGLKRTGRVGASEEGTREGQRREGPRRSDWKGQIDAKRNTKGEVGRERGEGRTE